MDFKIEDENVPVRHDPPNPVVGTPLAQPQLQDRARQAGKSCRREVEARPLCRKAGQHAVERVPLILGRHGLMGRLAGHPKLSRVKQ